MGLVWQRTLGASSDLPWVGAREQCRREIFAEVVFYRGLPTNKRSVLTNFIDYVAGKTLKTPMLLKIESGQVELFEL